MTTLYMLKVKFLMPALHTGFSRGRALPGSRTPELVMPPASLHSHSPQLDLQRFAFFYHFLEGRIGRAS